MVNFIENEEKSEIDNITKHNVKESKLKFLQNHITGIKDVVNKLENSLTESHLEQRHLLIQMHMDDMKNQNVTSQLDEARKENKQLLNILQQKNHENEIPRSQIDLSPAYSSMSVVNLQYKYDELMAKYEGLLKVMISKDKDIQRCHKENEKLTEEMNCTHNKLDQCQHILKRINKLKNKKEAFRLAHNQVLKLLHQEYLRNEDLLEQELHKTLQPARALLLQEMQRSIKLQHENILLKQKIVCLNSKCTFPNLKIPRDYCLEEKLEK